MVTEETVKAMLVGRGRAAVHSSSGPVHHYATIRNTLRLQAAARPVGYAVVHSRYKKQLKAVVCICHAIFMSEHLVEKCSRVGD